MRERSLDALYRKVHSPYLAEILGAWILHKGFTRKESSLAHDHQHFFVHENDVIAVLE